MHRRRSRTQTSGLHVETFIEMPEHDFESGTSADTERTGLKRDHVGTTRSESCVCDKVCCVILVLLVVGFQVAMFSVGGSKFHDCPAGPFIPTYLLGASGIPIVIWLFFCSERCRWLTIILLPLIAVGWFIAGNICVYIIYGKFNKTNRTAENYCDPGLYYFTFVVNVLGYIALIVGCVSCGVSHCRESSQKG